MHAIYCRAKLDRTREHFVGRDRVTTTQPATFITAPISEAAILLVLSPANGGAPDLDDRATCKVRAIVKRIQLILAYTVLYFKLFLLPPLLKYIDFTSVSVGKKKESNNAKKQNKKKYKKRLLP